MSTSAGLLANVIPAVALTQDTTLAAPQRNNFSSSVTPTAANCEFISTQVSSATELICRISRSSSQQNFETDSGKSSCSPAILDCSFDSGIGGVVANVATGGGVTLGGGSDDCAVIDEQIVGATNRTAPRICGDGGASDSFGVVTVTGLGIGTGISCNAEEQMRLKLRYERLQQWRIILLALDRQKDPYRLLRERLSKIGERRISRKRPTNDSICYVCSCQIEQNDSNSFATCYLCNKRICRGAKCSNWLPKSGRWECHLCHSSNDSLTHTQSWVAEQMCFNRQKYVYPMRARSEIYIPIGDFNEGPLHFESVSQVGLNSDAITAEQKLKIREYVEEVVAKLLGGSLDQIRVSQLSKSENYLHLFEQYHSKLSNIFINLENELSNKALNGDLPGIVNSHVVPQSTLNLNNDQSNNNSNAHMPSELPELSQTRLRQMIESIIAETLRMPPLANGSVSEIALNKDTRSNGSENNLLLENGSMRLRHRHRTEHYFEPKIYQDLLATAVLNKIADKEGNIRQFSESTPDLSSCNIDTNFNVENRSTSSGSSVEPRSDFSYTDTEQVPKISKDAGRESALSDYIAAHTVPLPDLSAAVTESEEDDHASISSSILAEGTWEDNWLFKKKRSSLTASMTGSVGMLVPAPKDDVRAQIGDKTTDEISDLSEMGSDTDDSSLKIVRTNLDPLNDRILNKHLIGGQNTKVVLDELIETASLISNTTQSVDEPKYAETRNKYVVEAASKIKAINPNVTKHSAQEGETILDNPEKEREQNSLSDQLSSDSNRTDESTSTTIESFLADFNNEQDMPLTNISNNTSADTTELTNGSYLSLSPSYSKFNINQEQHFINNNNNHQQDFNREDDDVVHLRYFVPGSIAEREYKKWNNAVEMPNNPYAPEALKRRISGSQERFMDLPNISQSTNKSPISLIKTTKSEALAENESRSDIDYKRYSRDYYINDDKVLKTSPKHQIITTDSNCPSLNISDEPTADIAINESLSEKNETHAIENPIEPHPAVYQALPAQVVEENTSIETLSNQSMQSVNTTTSDDSDTVRIYNFKEQKTIVVRNGDKASTAVTTKLTPETYSEPTLQVTVPLSPTLEDAPRCPISEQAAECETRQPTESTLEANINSSSITVNRTPITPTRGSTPMAFKFLQPKRKLIDPSQVLSLDEGADALSIFSANEKAVVEEEVAQVMPSVKALAQAFILSSSKYTIAEKRWKKGVQNMPSVSSKPIFKQEAMQKTEASTSIAEIAEDATIASDLSSLETDPPTNKDLVTVRPTDDLSPITPSPTNSPTSDLATKVEGNKSATNALRRISMLKSNIAFFENLRFK